MKHLLASPVIFLIIRHDCDNISLISKFVLGKLSLDDKMGTLYWTSVVACSRGKGKGDVCNFIKWNVRGGRAVSVWTNRSAILIWWSRIWEQPSFYFMVNYDLVYGSVNDQHPPPLDAITRSKRFSKGNLCAISSFYEVQTCHWQRNENGQYSATKLKEII